MMSLRVFLVLVLAALAYAAPAADEVVVAAEPEKVQEPPMVQATERFANISSLSLPSDFSSSSLMQILASGGAVVLALVGVAAVIALVMPLFGFKQLCYLLGTCSDPSTASNSGYFAGAGVANGLAQAYDAYHTYNQPGSAYANNPSYQKRSLAYFGPILKALNAAYEKYETMSVTPVKRE